MYGAPPGDSPIGILGNPGTHKETFDWNSPDYEALTEFERLAEIENSGLGTFGYILHPDGKKILRDTAKMGAQTGSESIWEGLTPPVSSMVVATETDIFFGSFGMMTIGIWGEAADIVVDPYTRAGGATVQITASLYADVVLRNPACFVVARATTVPRTADEVRVTTKAPTPPPPVEPKEPPAAQSEVNSEPAKTDVRANNPDNGPGNGPKGKPFKNPFR